MLRYTSRRLAGATWPRESARTPHAVSAEERYLEGVAQQVEQAEDWETLEAVAVELSTSPSQPGTQQRVDGPDPSSAAIPDVRVA